MGNFYVNPPAQPYPPRGTVIFVGPDDNVTRYVVLSDLNNGPRQADQPPMWGVIQLAQKLLPNTVLYPNVAGGATTGLAGVWRARADRLCSIHANRFRRAGVVTPQELTNIDNAVQTFLGL